MVENVGGELEIPVFNFACKTLCGPWEFTEIQLENFGLEHNTEVSTSCIPTESNKWLRSKQTIRVTSNSTNCRQPHHIVEFS